LRSSARSSLAFQLVDAVLKLLDALADFRCCSYANTGAVPDADQPVSLFGRQAEPGVLVPLLDRDGYA